MTKHGMFLLLYILPSLGGPAFAEEMMMFGGSRGWNETTFEGLWETEGWRGMPALTLAPLGRNPFEPGNPNSDIPFENIDLLLLAEGSGLENPAGGYMVRGDWELSTQFMARGRQSLKPVNGGIVLEPPGHSMWMPGTQWGDFTLDFRLRPVTLRNGEVFFSWAGRWEDGTKQSVVASVQNRRLVWEFKGFFRYGQRRFLNLTLTGPPLVPGEWRHHRIRFNSGADAPDRAGASPGLLEYLVDGVPADMVHATPNGREGFETFTPQIGLLSRGPILLAPSFTCYMDEFRLASAYAATPPSGGYSNREAAASGMGRTPGLDAGFPGSSLTRIRARAEAPGFSRIRFYARGMEDFPGADMMTGLGSTGFADEDGWRELSMTMMPEDPMGESRWFEWEPPEPFTGRFFQVGYSLSPDPADDLAPVLSSLEVEWEPRRPPRPPRGLRLIVNDDGRQVLSWSGEAEAGLAGWWVSWGPRPGDYVSAGSDHSEDRGTAWIPYVPGQTPSFMFPSSLMNHFTYASIRAAWNEGAPVSDRSGYPGDYRALSLPTREVTLNP